MAKDNRTQTTEVTSQARNALRTVAIVLGLAGAADIIYFALAFYTGTWQLFAWAIDIFGVVIVCLVSIWLIRRDRSVLAIWLILGGAAVVMLLATLWVAGFGLALALVCVIGLSQISVQALPARQTSLGVAACLVAGAAIILLDLYGPANRLAAPAAMTPAVWFIGVATLLVMGFLTVRQFVSYTLHTKLIIAFLTVALISVGLLAFLNNRATRARLTNDANQALLAAASQTAINIDAFINTNLDVIRTEAQLPLWSRYLKLVADQKSDSTIESEVRTTLRAFSRKTNISSYALIDLQGQDVMDTFASHIGTDKSDRKYFQEPLKSGLPYASPVELSPATGRPSLYFSSPVRSSAGHVVGVLRMRYDVTVLQSLVAQNNELAGPGSFAVLFDEYHIRLAHGTAPERILQAVAPLDPAQVAELQATYRLPDLPTEELSTNLPALEQNLAKAADQPYFALEDAAISGRTNQVAVTTLKTQPWLVAFFQPQDVFLAPVKAQERSAMLLAVVIAVLVVAAALGLAQILVGPIIRLTAVATSVAAGDLSAQAQVESSDEIGTLATTFNNMTGQLRELVGGLEQRVAERTRGLQAAAEVSRAATSVLEPGELLRQTVNLIRDRFDLYYVGLFLLDEAGRWAVLQAATGEAGQQMMAQGHRLEVGGASMVGWCAAKAQARIALDVGEEAVRFDNPLLPDTHSEMALPLVYRGRVIGVLDVQSTEETAFDEADIAVMQTMADQLANAIENARLFEETQRLARREQTISQITGKLRGASNLEDILQTTVQELGQALGASEAVVRLGTETTLLSRQIEIEPGDGDGKV